MPVYTYRREDGTLFDVRQSFSDEALAVDPATGQKVVRVVQNAGVIFKGSGFYTTDAKGSRNGKASGESKTESKPAASEPTSKPAESAAPSTAAAAD
ncbi:MAG: hypothetical protein IPM16_02830 [Chloroflexi bacterium]|nr:hypothetical protein [Chloroflexota bacterium]